MRRTWQRQTGSARHRGCHRNQAGHRACLADVTLLGFSEKGGREGGREGGRDGRTKGILSRIESARPMTNLPVGDSTEVEVECSTPEYSNGPQENNGENCPRLPMPPLQREGVGDECTSSSLVQASGDHTPGRAHNNASVLSSCKYFYSTNTHIWLILVEASNDSKTSAHNSITEVRFSTKVVVANGGHDSVVRI